jgi:hypothetical protein
MPAQPSLGGACGIVEAVPERFARGLGVNALRISVTAARLTLDQLVLVRI